MTSCTPLSDHIEDHDKMRRLDVTSGTPRTALSVISDPRRSHTRRPGLEHDSDRTGVVQDFAPFQRSIGPTRRRVAEGTLARIPLPFLPVCSYTSARAVVVVEGAPVRFYLTETAAMIIFGPLLVIAGICFICWLLSRSRTR